MKNIKFRFWTGSLMEQWDHAKHWESLGFYLNGGDNYIPMMFTGLFDRHGKEIYEGDIVNSHTNFELPYFREVVYDRCGLTFKPQSGFILCKENEFHFEVIGNIYENPELLKK